MSRPGLLRYCAAAGALGLGWFGVLLFPATTREWLLEDVPWNLVFLPLASILVALPARGFIEGAGSLGARLLRAVVMPYLGCLIYLTLWAAALTIRSLAAGQAVNVHDTGSLYVMGLTATTIALPVVVPYGLLCQYAMERVSFRTIETP